MSNFSSSVLSITLKIRAKSYGAVRGSQVPKALLVSAYIDLKSEQKHILLYQFFWSVV